MGILSIIPKSEIKIKGIPHAKQSIAGIKWSKDDKKNRINFGNISINFIYYH